MRCPTRTQCRKPAWPAFLAAVWFPIFATLAQDQNPPAEQMVRLLESKGRVDVLHTNLRLPAKPHQSLVPADRLQTWTNSHANLLWYGRAHFQVSELSDITIPPPPGSNQRSTLEVLRGFLYFFHRGPPREIEIKTPTAAAIVLGTEFSVRVEAGGRTVLQLFDGTVELSNPQGQARVNSGEQATIDPGQAPIVTPILEGINDLIQWFLYYPGVLNPDEAGFTPAEEQVLAGSLAAYRAGDLREALASYPAGRQPASDAERIYFSALLLAVGQVSKAEAQLAAIPVVSIRPATLATAVRSILATVKGKPESALAESELATVSLAESYRQQARGELERSLESARRAVQRAPQFGFGWARLAELEFSFGRTKPTLEAVDRALTISPCNAQALALKGFVLSAQNKVAAAVEFFDRAIALDGGLANAWLGRGLCRLKRGDRKAGRQDLLIAAAVEPQRALLRSYLGKAFSDAGEADLANHELQLARTLDANDPTALLYSALLRSQTLRFNEAVRDLEAAESLNENRGLFRSRLLLDQDRAVRGANLAALYREAGLTEVSVREATRAVTSDYANYSAHLFLANAYAQLRDPRQVNLRYETASLSEYLVANLLAPVGAGALSPSVSQEEYSSLFERDRLGLVSSTEYFSNGDWVQSAAQYGLSGNLSYLLDANYRSENGQRPNNDQEQLELSVQLKYQITPQDTVLFQPLYYDARGGDLTPYHDPASANRGFRFHETQKPQMLTGYHHEWSVGHHSMVIAGRLQDTFQIDNPSEDILVLNRQGGEIVRVGRTSATNEYRHEITSYFAEAQHIWKANANTLVLGARYHHGEFDTTMALSDSPNFFIDPLPFPLVVTGGVARVNTEFERAGAYAYDYLNLSDSLMLTAGAAYDWVQLPENWRSVPISSSSKSTRQFSPKAGLTWQPARDTTVRAGYTRSLGGVTIDQSYRLEPTQVAGFNQSYRSLIPESVAGNVPVPSFETLGLAVEQRFKTGLYLGLEGEWLKSAARQKVGAEEMTYGFVFPDIVYSITPSATRRELEFEERSLTLTVNQLLGVGWSIGARYEISDAALETRFPQLPSNAAIPPIRDESAVLHRLNLFVLYNHPSGFFTQAQSRWYGQQNSGDVGILGDEDLLQFDFFAGRRIPWRRAELRFGLLNVTGSDYRLYPLNLLPELPRQRTFTVSLKFNF